MEEMKCPEPKVTDRNETPKTSAARKRPGSWLQGNALKGRVFKMGIKICSKKESVFSAFILLIFNTL